MATIAQTFDPTCAVFRASGFPGIVQADGTNFPVRGCAFDQSTEESLYLPFRSTGYGGGNLTVDIDFYAASGTSGAVMWGCQMAALTPGDNQAIATDGLATATTVTTTHPGTTATRLQRSTVTVSNLDSLAADDEVYLRVYRVAANGADTLAADAIIVGLTVSYTSSDSGGGSSGLASLPFTIYVAASNASAAEKAIAGPTYTCDGTADDVQIQAAIAAVQAMVSTVPTKGGRVLLSPGTFTLAAQIVIDGGGDVDTEHDVYLQGAGPSETILDATPGTLASGVHLTGSCKAHLSDFRVLVDGATHGISSAGELTAGAVYRSFWQSSFKNLSVIGDYSTHSGYGYHFGSPFRSVFENLEANGVGNGMRMYSEHADFNPGDCVVSRCFMDLVGNSRRGYSIESTTSAGNMNQIEFLMCEAIASGTGCIGIYLGGTGPVNYTRWHGVNLEQFDLCLQINNGAGNWIEGNFWCLRDTSTATKLLQFDAGAIDNWVRSIGMWYTATSQVFITSTATDTTQPNLVEHVKIQTDGGTQSNSIGTAGAVIRKWIIKAGGTGANGILVTPA